MKTCIILAAGFVGLALAQEKSPLEYEHPGGVFRQATAQSCCTNGVLRDVQPAGEMKSVGGGESSCS